MAITVSGTTITFNDTTTMTTAATGTVSSVATGNGLSGGTITTTGTLTIAAPTFNSVGSYCSTYFLVAGGSGTVSVSSGTNYSAGSGNAQLQSYIVNLPATNNLSGTWKWMAGPGTKTASPCPGSNDNMTGISVRVS